MATRSALSLPPADDPLRAEVARLFCAFQRLYPNRWERQFSDDKARPAWLAALRHAGVAPADVRRGLAKASALKWPPSSGEFIELCWPEIPNVDVALLEAQRWARGHAVQWTHAAIGVAAGWVGARRLRGLAVEDVARVFGAAYRDAASRLRRGEDLQPPPTLVLVKPKAERAPSDSPVVMAEVAKLTAMLGVRL